MICNAEMPSVQRLHNDFKSKGLATLIVSVDTDGIDKVKPYMIKNGYSIPCALDAELNAANAYAVLGTPTTFITNRKGEIVAKGFGPVDFDNPEFRSYMQSLLNLK
jgi:hypothetical protein